MKNDKTSYKINLTHIATSYPETVDVPDDIYEKIQKAPSTSDAIDTFLNNKLGMSWHEDFFFDSLSHIKI